MEARKLYTQMTSEEQSLLNSFLTKDNFTIGKHTKIRRKERVICNYDIHKAIISGDIIEYHYKDDNRILVRGRNDIKGFNVCVVLSLDNNYIITAYDNQVSDKHYTLDKSKYNEYFDILSMFN